MSYSRPVVLSECHRALKSALQEMSLYPSGQGALFHRAAAALTQNRTVASRALVEVFEFIDQERSRGAKIEIPHEWCPFKNHKGWFCAGCHASSSLEFENLPRHGCYGEDNIAGVFYHEEQPPSKEEIDWYKWYSHHFNRPLRILDKPSVGSPSWEVDGPGEWILVRHRSDGSLYFERGRFSVSFAFKTYCVIADGGYEHFIPRPLEGETVHLARLDQWPGSFIVSIYQVFE